MPPTTAKICLRRNGFDDANNTDGGSPRAHQRELAQTNPHGASVSSSRDSPPRTGNRMQYGTKTRDFFKGCELWKLEAAAIHRERGSHSSGSTVAVAKHVSVVITVSDVLGEPPFRAALQVRELTLLHDPVCWFPEQEVGNLLEQPRPCGCIPADDETRPPFG
jgi:hypothetical protein